MLDFLKKVFLSKWFRLVFSIGLFYVAFLKIDIKELVANLLQTPWWFVLVMMGYGWVSVLIASIRWSYLLLEKPTVKDYWAFMKATYTGGFYNLFLSSSVGGDLLKWLPLTKRYPHLTKIKIASSVLIDRIVGFSAFVLVGFVGIIVGKGAGFVFSGFLFWLFFGLFSAILFFYAVVYFLDFEKIFGRYVFLKRFLQVVDVLKKGNKKRILIGFLISLLGQPLWISTTWMISAVLGAGMSLISVFVFVPVINLILTLPISVGGFGARENLFIYFFSQAGISNEMILLVSTYNGVIGVLSAVIGGLILLFDNLKLKEK